jgi:xylulokinase
VSGDILSVDVGTSSLKLGVFSRALEQRCEATRHYPISTADGRAEIDPELWWQALVDCCRDVAAHLSGVSVISLSVTTPGLTPMAADGTAVAPAILFLDQRSGHQAAAVRKLVGEEHFLEVACNLPAPGGSSLCSMLWFRDEQPDVWASTSIFGHTNTYMIKRLTGRWAVDPGTASITGLYRTAANDLSWDAQVLEATGISPAKLPPLVPSHEVAGRLLPGVARELGLPADAATLCGGNDAVLGALAAGVTAPGDILISTGTADIICVCLDRPLASRAFNLRTHVLPGRWVTFMVLNAGGKALEWFRTVFCPEMSPEAFHSEYVPSCLEAFLGAPDPAVAEERLPDYIPFLAGSRYSLEPRKASLDGLSLETTREDCLVGLIRGNVSYLASHLTDVRELVRLSPRIALSGGGSRSPAMVAARRRWTGNFEFVVADQSSLRGAAILGSVYLGAPWPASAIEP